MVNKKDIKEVESSDTMLDKELDRLTKTELLKVISELKKDKGREFNQKERFYPDPDEYLKEIGMKPEDMPIPGQIYAVKEGGGKTLVPLRFKRTRHEKVGRASQYAQLRKVTNVTSPPRVTSRETVRASMYPTVSYIKNSLGGDEPGGFDGDAPVTTVPIMVWKGDLDNGLILYHLPKPHAPDISIPIEQVGDN